IIRETRDERRGMNAVPSAYIYKATLKVMLEEDYLKGQRSRVKGQGENYAFKDQRSKVLNEYSSQLIRELIVPRLTKEINSSKRYAPLRQVYYSLILSRWFKLRFRGQKTEVRGQKNLIELIDTQNLTNLTSKQSWSKNTYFKQYQASFTQGEYNTKEPVYTPTGQAIRSYFSGGLALTGPLPISAFSSSSLATLSLPNTAVFGGTASSALFNIKEHSLAAITSEPYKRDFAHSYHTSLNELPPGAKLAIYDIGTMHNLSGQETLFCQIFLLKDGSGLEVKGEGIQKISSSEELWDWRPQRDLEGDFTGYIFEKTQAAPGRKQWLLGEEEVEIYPQGERVSLGKQPKIIIDYDTGQNKLTIVANERIYDGRRYEIRAHHYLPMDIAGLSISEAEYFNRLEEALKVLKDPEQWIDLGIKGEGSGRWEREFSYKDWTIHIESPAFTNRSYISLSHKNWGPVSKGILGNREAVDYGKELIITTIANEIKTQLLAQSASSALEDSQRTASSALGEEGQETDGPEEMEIIMIKYSNPGKLKGLRDMLSSATPSHESNDVYEPYDIRNIPKVITYTCSPGGGLRVYLDYGKLSRKEFGQTVEITVNMGVDDEVLTFISTCYDSLWDRDRLRADMDLLKDDEKALKVKNIIMQAVEQALARSSSSSLQAPNKMGAIDFRAMPMAIQPMGIFKGLDFSLPKLSRAELERINTALELEQIKNMLESGTMPSGQRVKELVAACMQKGKMSEHQDSLLLCLLDICKLEEENAVESSPELREALVIVSSQG
ncbi:MAG: hypothetical protein V1925_05625, partial [Candidatus Omnitrophota bacterium]